MLRGHESIMANIQAQFRARQKSSKSSCTTRQNNIRIQFSSSYCVLILSDNSYMSSSLSKLSRRQYALHSANECRDAISKLDLLIDC